MVRFGEQSWRHHGAVCTPQQARINDVAVEESVIDAESRGSILPGKADQLLKNARQKDPYKSTATTGCLGLHGVSRRRQVNDACASTLHDRLKLSVYGMAMYGLALEKEHQKEN